MNKFLIVFFISTTMLGQKQAKEPAFVDGEWLRYKMSYSGFLRAGTAELTLEETELNGEKVYHSTGRGWTTGMIKWFFKVEDDYQTYFRKDSTMPYLFKRKINEGDYKKHVNTTFNHETNKALVLTEDTLFGSVASDIASLINEQAFDALDAPVLRVGSLDTPVPFAKELEEGFLAKAQLKDRLEYLLNY